MKKPQQKITVKITVCVLKSNNATLERVRTNDQVHEVVLQIK